MGKGQSYEDDMEDYEYDRKTEDNPALATCAHCGYTDQYHPEEFLHDSCSTCGRSNGLNAAGPGARIDTPQTEYESDEKNAQSDNQAAARATSNNVQTPPDRSGDKSRQFQGSGNFYDHQEMRRENVHEITGGY